MAKRVNANPTGRFSLSKPVAHIVVNTVAGFALTVAFGVAMYEIWEYLIHRPEFMIYPSQLRLRLPPWTTPLLAEEICDFKRKGLKDAYSIFDPNLTRDLARAYESSPWVLRVESVKRVFPNRVRIRLVLRRPIAAIRFGQGFYLADADAVRLPNEFYRWGQSGLRLPVVIRGKLVELPAPGKRWLDPGVRAAIDLLKFLNEHGGLVHKLRITSIDATHFGQCRLPSTLRPPRQCCLVLYTEDQTKILWGCSPLCHRVGALSQEQKLNNLLSVAKAYDYDFSHLEYVDVRWDTPVARVRGTVPSSSGR